MQDNNIKVSVIMPVYNVEQYLNKAVDSVLCQSLTDFELFLVDDGSTDNSGKICDEYKLRDKRVKVIHEVNQGAHNARNNALDVATGKYVCFFDSDDFVDKNMLKDLYEIAEKYESDLVISGFYIHTYYDDNNFVTLNYIPNIENSKYENEKYFYHDSIEGVESYHNIDLFRKNAYKNFDKNMFYSPWNKLYKLSYLNDNNLRFPITYRDDFPFVLSVIRNISNVSYTVKQYYHFIRKRSDSETQKYVSNFYEKREEEHSEMIDLYNYWQLKNDKDSFEMIARRYIDRIIECMVNLFNTECKLTSKEKRYEISKYIEKESFIECIRYAKPNKLYLKVMYIPLKLKSVLLCYFMSYVINIVKNKNIKLFSVLKTNR